MKKNWFPPSIAAYAGLFIFLIVLLFGGLGWVVLDNLQAFREKSHLAQQQAARAEIGQTVEHVLKEMQQAGQLLANWDEVRQQLGDPVYYTYWRESRARSAGVLPKFLEAVELYGKDGKALSPRPLGGMPGRLTNLHAQSATVVARDGKPVLFYFIPVWADADRQILLGYGGLKLDITAYLNTEHPPKFFDIASLRIKAGEGETIPAADLPARLQYTLLQNPEIDSLVKLTVASVYQTGALIMALSLAFYVSLVSLLGHPLRRLSQHIDALREGRGGFLADSYRGALPVAELEKVRLSLNDYQKQLDDLHVSLESKNDELWSLAHHDPLTGVYNRRAFEEDWEYILSIAAGRPVDVSFILFDCDHFKAINDTYGHQVGDAVINGISEALQQTLRSGDRLYRLGGDEFAMLLPETTAAQAIKAAERCVEQVNAHDFSAVGVKEPVRISVGLSHARGTDADNLATLQKQADIAMYYAKRPGQNKISMFAENMISDSFALVSNWVANAVYEAIGRRRPLEMHYQPIVRLPDGETAYYEALVRIREGNELIMPGNIFPIVEGRRLDAEFDIAVIEQVGKDLASGVIPGGTGVAVNISGASIILPGILERLTTLTPFVKTHKIVLEVTETALITQINRASSHLAKLRDAGFVIALDDFGSGYSSLMYLANMPVDLIKFDISLIRTLNEGGQRQRRIVENLARLIASAGYELLAEGIENQEMFDKISGLGFSHAQGYFFGRPARLG